MTISPIEGVASALPTLQSALNNAPTNKVDFASYLSNQLENVDGQIKNSDQLLDAVSTGSIDNLHQVMIALEEAKLSFQLLVQVRNRLLEGYQEIMHMQI